jgi:hypothetical protein
MESSWVGSNGRAECSRSPAADGSSTVHATGRQPEVLAKDAPYLRERFRLVGWNSRHGHSISADGDTVVEPGEQQYDRPDETEHGGRNDDEKQPQPDGAQGRWPEGTV